MNVILIFVVIGLTSGAIYALVAVGLALTYKTSGILNFAQGALAIVAVDAYIYLTINRGYSWELAALVSVFVVGAALGIAFELLGRVLVRSAPALRVAATVGVLLAIQGGSVLLAPHLPGSTPHFTLPPLPATTVSIAGVNIGEDQLIVMAVSLVVMLLLSAFLKFTRVGLALRAVVDNPDLVNCSGRNPRTLRRLAWILGCTFAALSGVLLAMAPSFGPDSGQVARLVIPAFAAAAIGYFTNLPLVYLGALGIGIASSLATRYVHAEWLLALPASVPVVVLLVALMVTPARRLAERWGSTSLVARPPRRGGRLAMAASGALFIALAFVPSWAGFDINIYTTGLVYVLLFLSLGLLVRESGQVSLCHLAFAAVGATTFAHFATELGLPWVAATVGAGLVAAAVGALVAVTAIRLSGVFLALATLAFGFILQQFVYGTGLMFGPSTALAAPRPVFGRSDDAFYFVVLGLVAATSLLVVALHRTRLGRLLRGMAAAPVALEAQGTTLSVTKLVVFAVSAFLAGLAGALLMSVDTVVTASPFSATESLVLVAVLFVLPVAEPWYAVAAALVYYVLPIKLNISNAGAWTSLVFGTASVVSVLLIARSVVRRVRIPWRHVPAPDLERAPHSDVHAAVVPDGVAVREQLGLVVTGVTVRFGGVLALDNVDVSAPIGRITGLIGPNGAGKTTLFNVSSGLVRPASGQVRLRDRDLSRSGPAGRARRGLGRTFQQPPLFEGMTVAEAVALGREASLAGWDPSAQLVGRRGDAALVRAAVDEALGVTGLVGLRDAQVGRLPTGERRLVELARCLAGPFDVVLLDEPSAGLDRTETDRLGDVLRRVVATRDVGILLVEHDMALVMDLCAHVYVIDFGRMIFDGTPEEVTGSPLVRAAYLGEELVAP